MKLLLPCSNNNNLHKYSMRDLFKLKDLKLFNFNMLLQFLDVAATWASGR